ncbi:hypothetical protein HPB47_007813 [Ixodes persulcatus]|uniref:Uncharacterized protein n=1 Tax=Ixodes persulcatus TaxID=34615 RepID=A0AC60P6C5_IXOPE|nr:hypothetical protein HPB47_007813 [Ixodes persulcatus]
MAAATGNGCGNDAAPNGNRVFYTLKVDIALLLEVQASDPFRNPDQWEEIAVRLKAVLGKPFSSRSVRGRFDLLVSRYATNDRRNLQKSTANSAATPHPPNSAAAARKAAVAARDAAASSYAAPVYGGDVGSPDMSLDTSSASQEATAIEIFNATFSTPVDDAEQAPSTPPCSLVIEPPVAETPAASNGQPRADPQLEVSQGHPVRGKRRQEQQADYDFMMKRMRHETLMKEKETEVELRRLALEENRLAWERERALMEAREREEDRRERAEERQEEHKARVEERQSFILLIESLLSKINK